MNTCELLKRAIEDRLQVVARYDGAERVFSPHALGTKRGERHVLVYQFAGESARGLPVGGEWRCLRVGQLADAAVQPGEWHTSANLYNPQTCLDEIDVVAQPLPPRTPTADPTDAPAG